MALPNIESNSTSTTDKFAWKPLFVTGTTSSALGQPSKSREDQDTSAQSDLELLPIDEEQPSATSFPDLVSMSDLEDEIKYHFAIAQDEHFEDGMESNFSRNLTRFIMHYSSIGIDIIADLILTDTVNPVVAGEALRWIGGIEHPITYPARRWLLARSLKCSSLYIRDGASLGLASMDDPAVIPYLEYAITQEKIPELREDMIQVLEQLEDTRREMPK